MDINKFADLKKGAGSEFKKDVEQTVKKYSEKSQSQLMEELAQAKKQGLINEKSAKDFLERFGKMMTPDQRKNAENLLKNL